VAVHKLLCVCSNSLGDLRMTVTETGYVNTGGEVNVLVAVNVGEGVTETGVECNREQANLAGVTLHVCRATLMNLAGLGAGKLSLNKGYG